MFTYLYNKNRFFEWFMGSEIGNVTAIAQENFCFGKDKKRKGRRKHIWELRQDACKQK
jgi:hypothetical protein